MASCEKGTGECREREEDGSCFSGSFFWFLSTSDCCPQRSRVERREQSPHPTQTVQRVQLCLAPRYRWWGKMEHIGGGEETSLPKLLGACGG